MFIEKMTMEEKEELKKLCYDCMVYQKMESEAKKEKDNTKTKMKKILDKYGYNAKETLDIYKIEYETQTRREIDSEALKACGLYDKFLKTKEQKPLTVR